MDLQQQERQQQRQERQQQQEERQLGEASYALRASCASEDTVYNESMGSLWSGLLQLIRVYGLDDSDEQGDWESESDTHSVCSTDRFASWWNYGNNPEDKKLGGLEDDPASSVDGGDAYGPDRSMSIWAPTEEPTTKAGIELAQGPAVHASAAGVKRYIDPRLVDAERVFHELDTDNNGLLDAEELMPLIERFFPKYSTRIEKKAKLERLRAQLDGNADGGLSFEEFAGWYLRKSAASPLERSSTRQGVAAVPSALAVNAQLGVNQSKQDKSADRNQQDLLLQAAWAQASQLSTIAERHALRLKSARVTEPDYSSAEELAEVYVQLKQASQSYGQSEYCVENDTSEELYDQEMDSMWQSLVSLVLANQLGEDLAPEQDAANQRHTARAKQMARKAQMQLNSLERADKGHNVSLASPHWLARQTQ